MKTAVVNYQTSNGNQQITTKINGTIEEIKKYFHIGRVFNLGNGEFDFMGKIEGVSIFGDKSAAVTDEGIRINCQTNNQQPRG